MRYFFTILLAVCAFPFWADASGSREPLGEVEVRVNSLEARGDSMYLRMQIILQGQSVFRNRSLTFTPVLVDSSHECELIPVLVNSRQRQRAFHRSEVLQPDGQFPYYRVLVARKQSVDTVAYSAKVARAEWMSNARVQLRLKDADCSDCYSTMELEFANWPYSQGYGAERLLTIQNYVVPAPEGVKLRTAIGNANLDFQVNESRIDLGFHNNRSEMKGIYTSISNIQNNTDVHLSDIRIQGFASPDGDLRFNNELSFKRAVSLKNNIQDFFKLDSILFQVEGKGENWDGLNALLQSNDNSRNDSVFDAIRGSSVNDKRKEMLVMLANGTSYQTLLKQYFSVLRKVSYQVRYVVRQYSSDELNTIYAKDPGHLSQNELYTLAESFGQSSPAFDGVIKKTLELYPNDTTANINAAAVFLRCGETDLAGSCLDKCADKPSAFNNLGAYYMQTGNLPLAETFLIKAVAMNIPEADRNLMVLRARMKMGK